MKYSLIFLSIFFNFQCVVLHHRILVGLARVLFYILFAAYFSKMRHPLCEIALCESFCMVLCIHLRAVENRTLLLLVTQCACSCEMCRSAQ